jgi:hypothetical protein
LVATAAGGVLAWQAVLAAGSYAGFETVRPLTAAEVSFERSEATVTTSTVLVEVEEPSFTPGPAVSEVTKVTGSSVTTQPLPVITSMSPPTVAQPETQTYQVAGGSASFRVTGEVAELLWAQPNSGYRMEAEQEEREIEVKFTADHYVGRVTAKWRGDRWEIVTSETIEDD